MTKKKKEKISAADLIASLNADLEFIAKRDQAERERHVRESAWQRAEAPLIEELRAAGIMAKSAWDLVNMSVPYSDALPILLDHLQHSYPGPVREGIARALAVPEAKFGWEVLTRLYRVETEARPKDGLAVAIAAAADDDVIEDVIALVRDRRHGASRVLLLRALERSADSRARTALMELGVDPDLKKEIQVILGRLKKHKRSSEPSGGGSR